MKVLEKENPCSILKRSIIMTRMTIIREMLGDVQEVYDAIDKEKESAREFVHDAYKDIIENYDSRILKFKKKRKVIIAEQAIKDFENLLD